MAAAPFEPTSAPMEVLTSMTVPTVAVVLPSSVMTPTSAPYSVMTASPTSSPSSEPLLMSKLLDQLLGLQETMRACSMTKSGLSSAKPSRVLRRLFSSTASRPSRTCSCASASSMRVASSSA